MAFKMNGFNPGTGTGMGSSPNKAVTRTTGGTTASNKRRPVKRATDTSEPFMKASPTKMEGNPRQKHMAKLKSDIARMKKEGKSDEEIQAFIADHKAKLKEGKLDYLKQYADLGGPGSYVKEGGSVKTSMKDLPLYSAERKAEYDRRGWAYDDTITKKEETKKNEPESDPTPDPTTVTATGGKMDDITKPEYQVSSGSGRKKTTVTRKDDKVMSDEYTHRNIGDKRKRTMTDVGKNRSITHKEKFDKKGNKKKDKKKITMPDGTVVKIKNTKRGKKVKIRKKGQLFGKKVDPSKFEEKGLV